MSLEMAWTCHPAKCRFRSAAQSRQTFVVARLHPLAVRRVGDDPAGFRRRLQRAGIADFEVDGVLGQPCAFGVAPRMLDGGGIDVVAEQRRVQPGLDVRAGIVLQVLPAPRVVRLAAGVRTKAGARCRAGGRSRRSRQLRSGWCRCRTSGSSRGAAGSQLASSRLASCQVLAQRRFALIQPPSPLAQRFAAGIEIQRRGVG